MKILQYYSQQILIQYYSIVSLVVFLAHLFEERPNARPPRRGLLIVRFQSTFGLCSIENEWGYPVRRSRARHGKRRLSTFREPQRAKKNSASRAIHLFEKARSSAAKTLIFSRRQKSCPAATTITFFERAKKKQAPPALRLLRPERREELLVGPLEPRERARAEG